MKPMQYDIIAIKEVGRQSFFKQLKNDNDDNAGGVQNNKLYASVSQPKVNIYGVINNNSSLHHVTTK